MDHLNNLYSKILENKIELFTYQLNETDNDAVTICLNSRYGIFIDYGKFDTTKDEFCTIAHEYGHCVTGTTHKLYSPYQLVEQHEEKANRAAVHEFLTFETLFAATEKGYTEPWQIAEYLGLPEQFILLAIEIYKREGRLH